MLRKGKVVYSRMKKDLIFRIAIFLLCMALIAGIYTFMVIPSVRKEEQERYEKKLSEELYQSVTVLTYHGDTPLLEDTIITDAIQEYFTKTDMPAGCATFDYVSDFEDIRGLQLKYTICKGQQVSFQNFKEYLENTKGNEKLKEFQICSLVAGQAMPGRFVDILLRYPDGNCAVVVPKIQIYDIQRDESKENLFIKDKDELYTMVFAVDDNAYNDLVDACREGTLDIRIYIDAAQAASQKTYFPAGSHKV